MTQTEALQHVAAHLIGYLQGSAPDEIFETDDSRSERKIAKAMEDVTRRLAKMGQPRGKGSRR